MCVSLRIVWLACGSAGTVYREQHGQQKGGHFQLPDTPGLWSFVSVDLPFQIHLQQIGLSLILDCIYTGGLTLGFVQHTRILGLFWGYGAVNCMLLTD